MIKARFISYDKTDSLDVHAEMKEVPAIGNLVSLPPITGRIIGITWDLSGSDDDIIVMLEIHKK